MADFDAIVTAATAHQPQQFVIADGELDGAQAAGRWLSTTDPVDLEANR